MAGENQERRSRPPRVKVALGRPPKLTTHILESLALDIRNGTPIVRACLAHNIHRDTYDEWRRQGLADRAAGVDTLHREFSDTVLGAEGEAEADMWADVERGRRTGKKEDVASGRLALMALRTRFGRRYAAMAGEVPGAGGEDADETATPLGTPTQQQGDLSRLDDDELEQFLRLRAKMLGKAPPPPLPPMPTPPAPAPVEG